MRAVAQRIAGGQGQIGIGHIGGIAAQHHQPQRLAATFSQAVVGHRERRECVGPNRAVDIGCAIVVNDFIAQQVGAGGRNQFNKLVGVRGAGAIGAHLVEQWHEAGAAAGLGGECIVVGAGILGAVVPRPGELGADKIFQNIATRLGDTQLWRPPEVGAGIGHGIGDPRAAGNPEVRPHRKIGSRYVAGHVCHDGEAVGGPRHGGVERQAGDGDIGIGQGLVSTRRGGIDASGDGPFSGGPRRQRLADAGLTHRSGVGIAPRTRIAANHAVHIHHRIRAQQRHGIVAIQPPDNRSLLVGVCAIKDAIVVGGGRQRVHRARRQRATQRIGGRGARGLVQIDRHFVGRQIQAAIAGVADFHIVAIGVRDMVH